ncbi:hypothetical protein SDC9_202430 [bioreactor metagenome]|uniref:Uncharacterized protein n=1 Tax=bioreactor metagenome TaxID=1076179 RepID=A0A645J5L9_9ZZZZ
MHILFQGFNVGGCLADAVCGHGVHGQHGGMVVLRLLAAAAEGILVDGYHAIASLLLDMNEYTTEGYKKTSKQIENMNAISSHFVCKAYQ